MNGDNEYFSFKTNLEQIPLILIEIFSLNETLHDNVSFEHMSYSNIREAFKCLHSDSFILFTQNCLLIEIYKVTFML